MVDRDRKLTMLLSDAEREQLAELAESEGLNVSDYIRQWIRREHAAKFAKRASKR